MSSVSSPLGIVSGTISDNQAFATTTSGNVSGVAALGGITMISGDVNNNTATNYMTSGNAYGGGIAKQGGITEISGNVLIIP